MGIGIGIVLLVIGAILAFAVNFDISGIDVHVIGYIVMAGGVLALLFGLAVQMPRTRRNRSTSITTDQAGRQYVTERDDRIDGV